MTENKAINASENMIKWHESHKSRGLSRFIYDGIVNEELWAMSPKICFFLKEAYLKDDKEYASLNEWFKDYDVWRMWWVVSDWIYGIENTTVTSIPAFDAAELDKVETANKRIRSSAVINTKKSNGNTTSNHEDLMEYVDKDRTFIINQFKEVSPEIIVCGNTGYYFEIIFGYDPQKEDTHAKYNGVEINHNDFNEKGYVWAENVLIIDFCHPANRFMRMGKYYAFCALYQQALKEKENRKL